jgi:hypothetical protein
MSYNSSFTGIQIDESVDRSVNLMQFPGNSENKIMSQKAVTSALNSKQSVLSAGENIKINSNVISADNPFWGNIGGLIANQEDLQNSLNGLDEKIDSVKSFKTLSDGLKTFLMGNENDGGYIVGKQNYESGKLKSIGGVCINETYPQIYFKTFADDDQNTLLTRIRFEVHEDGFYYSNVLSGDDNWKLWGSGASAGLVERIYRISVPKESWSQTSNFYTCEINDSRLKSTNFPDVKLDTSDIISVASSQTSEFQKIDKIEIRNNYINFYAFSEKPTVDLDFAVRQFE